MPNLKETARFLIESSKGQLNDLELTFYQDDHTFKLNNIERLHLERCAEIDLSNFSVLRFEVKLGELEEIFKENGICFGCWSTFSENYLPSLVGSDSEALLQLINAFELEAKFASDPVSIEDFEIGGRGNDLIFTCFGINDALRSSLSSEILREALEIAKSKLDPILSELREYTDKTQDFLSSQLAWDMIAYDTDVIISIVTSIINEAKLRLKSNEDPLTCADDICDQLFFNKSSLEGTLAEVRYNVGQYLDEQDTDIFMKAFTPKILEFHESLKDAPGPKLLVRVKTGSESQSYRPALSRLVIRYGFQSDTGGVFMVVPAFCHPWLTEHIQTGFQLIALYLGDSEAIIETTIRLNMDDSGGVYASLRSAYQAAVNLV